MLYGECQYFTNAINTIQSNRERAVDHEERYAYIAKDDIRIFSHAKSGNVWTVELSVDYHKQNSTITLSGKDVEDLMDLILSVGAYTTHGVRVNNFFIGVGAGFRYTGALCYSSYGRGTSDSYDGKYLIPIYARASCRFGSSSVKPMISFDLGTTFDVGQNQQYKNTEGLFYEPAVCMSIDVDEKTSLFITIGLNYQNAHHTFYSYSFYGASTEEICLRGTLHGTHVGIVRERLDNCLFKRWRKNLLYHVQW